MFYVDVILFGVDERIASMAVVNAFCMVCTAYTRQCIRNTMIVPLRVGHVTITSA